MSGRDKDAASVAANLKRAVQATNKNLPKAVRAAAQRKPKS